MPEGSGPGAWGPDKAGPPRGACQKESCTELPSEVTALVGWEEQCCLSVPWYLDLGHFQHLAWAITSEQPRGLTVRL